MSRYVLLNLIGTFLVTFAFLWSTISAPIYAPDLSIILFISSIIFGLILYLTGMMLEIKTRKQFRTIILKNRFTLNLDGLIIFICIMLLPMSVVIFTDINNLKYTGKFSNFTFVFMIWLLFVVFSGISYRKYFQKRISNNRPTSE